MSAETKQSFTSRVYRMVRRCPRGKVVSYGGVAALLGHPRAARGVGHALSALSDLDDVPWWRVVNRNGQISHKGRAHGAILQRKLLEAEGVKFDRRGRIDWKVYGWDGRSRSAGRTRAAAKVEARARTRTPKKNSKKRKPARRATRRRT